MSLRAQLGMMLALVVVSVLLGGCGGGGGGDSSILPDQNGATISGIVTDQDGQPVADAQVTAGGKTATTDATGHFEIDELQAGVEYLVIASKGGHTAEVRATTGAEEACELVLETEAPVTAASITGTVVDKEGTPVGGALVTAGSKSTTTNASGQFTIAGLQAGVAYTVTASKDGQSVTRTVTAPGQCELVLPAAVPDTSAAIAGVVVDSANNPVASAQVTAGGKSDTTDAQGAFAITGLATGTTYTVQATKDGYSATQQVVAQTGTPAQCRLELPIENLGSLKGRVVDTEGKKLTNVTVTADGRTATTDSYGRYVIASIPEADSVLVSAEAPNYDDAGRGHRLTSVRRKQVTEVEDLILAPATETGIPLRWLKAFSKSGWYSSPSRHNYTMGGVSYAQELRADAMSSSSRERVGAISWDVTEGGFTKLVGLFGVTGENKSPTNEVAFEIWGDNVRLHQTPYVHQGAPAELSVDITGVCRLEIRCLSRPGNTGSSVQVGMAMVELRK